MQWRWHQVPRRRSLTARLPFSHFPPSLAAIVSFAYRIWMTQRLARDLRYCSTQYTVPHVSQIAFHFPSFSLRQVDAAKEVELENATQQKQKALSEHLESVEFKRQVRQGARRHPAERTRQVYVEKAP